MHSLFDLETRMGVEAPRVARARTRIAMRMIAKEKYGNYFRGGIFDVQGSSNLLLCEGIRSYEMVISYGGGHEPFEQISTYVVPR